jgi:DNA modification methylase
MKTWRNQLFYGDNLEVLNQRIPDEYVDLIYLDAPFNSKANYSMLFIEDSGKKSVAHKFRHLKIFGIGMKIRTTNSTN